MAEFVLEIGCEELPASWLKALTAQLGSAFADSATRVQLVPRDVQVAATPRRLVVAATLAARQDDVEEQLFGPSLSVALDASGGWTKAAQGFARKHGVEPGALEQAAKDPAKPDERHLLYRRAVAGRPAAEVLPDVIASSLRQLAFPKRMNWDAWLEDGKGSFPFGRPIRWMLALLDGAVVPFAIYEMVGGARGGLAVESGAETRGHRFLPPEAAGRALPVRSLADLRGQLAAACVTLDPAERAASIREQLGAAGWSAGEDHGLLEEWRDLVELPTVLVGQVPSEFGSLPREVLETVLVHHQKYLPLVGNGRVTRFAAIANAAPEAGPAIVRGMERVVVARLRDAAFFWGEDRKRELSARIDDLSGVTFHRELGSYRDKADRLERLVGALADESGLAASEAVLARQAARLAKADLTTAMVGEFPELQGVMGGLYLGAEGADPAVAQAVRWHYHPVAVEADAPPAGRLSGQNQRVFAAVALLDKLDTLGGYFGLGLEPTGSRDPYGLRRAGQGVVRVLLDFWEGERAPGLRRLVAQAVAGIGERLKRSPEETSASLETFLLERLEQVLVTRGHARDVVQAVLAAPAADALADLPECAARVAALERVRAAASEDFEHLAGAFKRANNILGDATPGAPEAGLFEHPAERALHAAVAALGDDAGQPEERLRALTALRAPIDRFFDDVLVMAEDPAVRRNRLALLDAARRPFHRIADISKLGG